MVAKGQKGKRTCENRSAFERDPVRFFPWWFCFLGIFLAVDFLGFLSVFCFLQGFQGFASSVKSSMFSRFFLGFSARPRKKGDRGEHTKKYNKTRTERQKQMENARLTSVSSFFLLFLLWTSALNWEPVPRQLSLGGRPSERERERERETLKTRTSSNKKFRPFFLVDNSIWILPSVSSLRDYSIWRS